MDAILTYLLAGAAAGLIAGLFGVGGGLIIVPVLAGVFSAQQLAPEITMQLALGSSLATIVATSLSSIRAHHSHGAVLWPLVLKLTPGLALGTWVGAALADHSSSNGLRIGFGVAELVVAIYMFTGARKPPAGNNLPGAMGATMAGGVIGSLSSLAGIGGGTLMVPFLVRCRISIGHAIGTSAATGLPIAFCGALSYIIWGWNHAALPAHSSGYIYWPAVGGIVIASIFTAPLGAKLAHRLPAARLKQFFALLLALLGLKLLLNL